MYVVCYSLQSDVPMDLFLFDKLFNLSMQVRHNSSNERTILRLIFLINGKRVYQEGIDP